MGEMLHYLKILISPASYSSEKISKLEKMLAEYYGVKDIYMTENGRSALYIAIRSLDLPSGSKIALQPFTCNSAVNPIIWNGHKPIYIDTGVDHLNMSEQSFRDALVKEPDIKAIIIQYTFGDPTGYDEIIRLSKEKGIIVIEDCAHALGIRYQHELVGKRGDMSVISFGLEKVLPTKVGGALILNDQKYREALRSEILRTKRTSLLRSLVWAKNPFIRQIARVTGAFGKSFLIPILTSVGLFNTGFVKSELVGVRPKVVPSLMSPLIASITLRYFGMLDTIQNDRVEQCRVYRRVLAVSKRVEYLLPRWDGPFLKFPLIFRAQAERDRVGEVLRSSGFYLSDWYDPVIYPSGTSFEALGYVEGSCPNGEKLSRTVLNLPTGGAYDERIIEALLEIVRDTA